MPETLDTGYLVEGIVELEPMTGRLVISTRDVHGHVVQFDPHWALERYKGKEVRFTMISFEAIDHMAKLVEEGNLKVEDAVVGTKKD
jgi:hypothetical protein